MLRNTNSGEADYTKQSKNFCGHNDHRKQTAGLRSTHSQREPFGSDRIGQLSVVGSDERTCCTRVAGPWPSAREIAAPVFVRARFPVGEATGDAAGLAAVAAAACLRARFALGEAAGEAAVEGDAAVSAAEAVVLAFLCARFVGSCAGDSPGLGD